MAKRRYTVEDHRALGLALAKIHRDLTHRMVDFSNAFPMKGREGRAERLMRATLRDLEQARSELEEIMFSDFPDLPQDALKIYYPGLGVMDQ